MASTTSMSWDFSDAWTVWYLYHRQSAVADTLTVWYNIDNIDTQGKGSPHLYSWEDDLGLAPSAQPRVHHL